MPHSEKRIPEASTLKANDAPDYLRLQVQLEQANLELASKLDELSKAQKAEREQRILAETLRDTIAAINSSLDYDEVLDLILANLARVIPHDAANIALLDEHKVIHFERARGYKERGLEDFINSFATPVDYFPNWELVYSSHQPLIIPNTDQYPGWVRIPQASWINSFACAPIVAKETVIGFLNLDSPTAGFFKPEHTERLNIFANQAAIAVNNARLFRQTQHLAITDGLTEVFNRRYLLELAEKELERSRRHARPFSIILFDIDHFKAVNDQFGHPMGDLALKEIAALCRSSIRLTDLLGRYGGEEFLIIATETGQEQALEIAERFRKQVETFSLATKTGRLKLTISLGIATFQPGTDQTLDDLIKRTDNALYTAKALGRNCISSE